MPDGFISAASVQPFVLQPVPLVTTTPKQSQSPRETPIRGRVLHIINGEHFSGAERVQQLLGKRLGPCGYEALFACVKPGKFAEYCNLRTSQVSEYPMSGRLDLSVVKQLAHKVSTEGIDLLHAHTPRTALVSSLVSLRTGKPWVYHVHSPTSRDSTRGFLNRINGLIEKYSIRSCNRLLTVSKSLRREMLRCGVSRGKLSVVPNGVPAIEPIDPLERLEQTRWRLGMVALMRPRKGVEVALQALQKLKHLSGNLTLDFIGGFETEQYEQQVKALAQSLGVQHLVRWRGFTNDVPSAIRELDGLLLPSLFGEGMPMVVLEALAAGVPVVATRVEGTPEVVRHQIEGFLAEPRNAQSLTEQIQALMADRIGWAKMSDRALSRHRGYFSDEIMASRTAKAYDRVLEQSYYRLGSTRVRSNCDLMIEAQRS